LSVATPSRWHAPAQGVFDGGADDLPRWWEQFGDPTLSRLVVLALDGNVDVRVAGARVRQARAEHALARAALLPSVATSVSASRARGGRTTIAPGIDAGWEPDVLGRARLGVAAAAADADASAEDLRGAHVSLVAEVGQTYVELRTQQARLAIARENRDSQGETLTLTRFREQAGLVSRVDVDQAHADVEQTRAQIPSLESSIAQAIHRLSTLAGLEPAALADSLRGPAPLPEVPARIGVGIPAEVLRQRPDVRAAERRVVAESARLGQTRALRYPQFSLSGTIGAAIVAGVATGGSSVVASVAGSVAQTVFDAGRVRQQIAVRTAAQDAAVASYEGVVLAAFEEVEDALVALEGARQRLVSLSAAAEAAKSAAELARARYAAGLADFQTVLDTGRTVLSIQDGIASTRGARVAALIQLYKALGGGWSTETAAGKQVP
jgi:NodT family efflux transporter outer membrane factor (OMF) lipoprotein